VRPIDCAPAFIPGGGHIAPRKGTEGCFASLLMEGTFISAAVALLPISCLIWLALAPAALMAPGRRS